MANVISNWLTYQLKEKKLNTPLGWILMAFWGFAIAYTTARLDYHLTSIFLLTVMGIYIFLVCLRHPLIGLYFTIAFSTLFALPGRMFYIASPVGILVEVFTYVLWIAVLGSTAPRKEDTTEFWKNPITIGY